MDNTQRCSRCKKEFPSTPDYFCKKGEGLSYTCRECHREYTRNHYENNKKIYKEKARKNQRKVAEWFKGYKKKLKCIKCGEDRWWVLDFHHRDKSTKELAVSTLAQRGSKSKILTEISKCDVLCSNCHRDLHHHEVQ